MSSEANVPAIAKVIRDNFPELSQRAFAVMEAEITKENIPNLPLCFVALLGLVCVNQSNNVSTPTDLLEHIIIEFWYAPTLYTRADGSQSPFYAFQDYQAIMDRLLAALDGFFGPKRKPVAFLSLTTISDEFALRVTFKVSVKWRWCADKEVLENPIKIRFGINPDVSELPFGSNDKGHGNG